MSKHDISKYLKEAGKKFVYDVFVRSSDEAVVIYVDFEMVCIKPKRGCVSVRQLERLARLLSSKFLSKIEIIYLPSDKHAKIVSAAETLLKANFSDFIEDVSLSFITGDSVNAWVKVGFGGDGKKTDIETYLQSLLLASGVELVIFQWVDPIDKLPSAIDIMMATKKMQPVDISGYVSVFSDRFEKINAAWVNKQLDKLIKKNIVVRDAKTGTYSLTAVGLGIIPNSFSRESSDVTRALALGRRVW